MNEDKPNTIRKVKKFTFFIVEIFLLFIRDKPECDSLSSFVAL
ncbi:MAG: hypothetical protein JETT_2213 [Candidatus Jettenia ecosi]|uniref:Uncharacterized protein n=1 Tax=Candidatus Jettenia ecosi TaxID=2494326 RepID=A0A533QA08_9BACT|nr:MAG: hypothetical protein JETT_2213 [Candidatus Jettenia ecosi]